MKFHWKPIHLLQEAIDLVISKAGDDPNLTKLLIEFSKEKTDDDKNWDISAELLKVAQLITERKQFGRNQRNGR